MICRIPAERVTPPVRPEFEPAKANVPAPSLVIEPEPEIAPPNVKVFAVTVATPLPVKVTAPAPRFKLCVPVKVKSPSQPMGLLFVNVNAAVVVLLNVVPGLIVKTLAAAPKAVVLLMFRVP